ncbi:AtpZ/AtpI family protein [Chloroflexota bacterium]
MIETMTRQDELKGWALAYKMLGIGWYIAFCLAGGFAGGYFLDQYIDTFPVFTLVLLTLGLFVAFYGIYRMVLPLLKEAKNQDKVTGKEGRD